MTADGRERILVVVAHPDDETFGCGSLLAHATRHDVTTVVACATRGEAGSPAPGRRLDDADMAMVREAELREAAALLGVERVELFDWIDSGMDGPAAEGTLVAARLDEVASRIADVVDDVRSQTSPYEVMPAELRREFLTAECLKRVEPPWPGGPVETELW